MSTDSGSISIGRARVVTGLIGFVVTAGYIVLLAQLPLGSMAQPGAAVFPVIIASVMLVTSIVTVQDGRQMLRGDDERAELPGRSALVKIAVLLGALLFYAFTLRLLGRVIGTYTVASVILLVFAEKGRVWPLIHAAWITAFVWILFVHAFSLPLPRGFIIDL